MSKSTTPIPLRSSEGHVETARAALAPPLVKPRFGGIVAVCGECEKRSSGPSKLKAKHVRREVKRSLSGWPQKVRVVQCGCLGLCPKKAVALVGIAQGRMLCSAEVRHAEEAPALVEAMREPAGAALAAVPPRA